MAILKKYPILTLVLSLVAGALQAINYYVVSGISQGVHAAIATGVLCVVALGVQPLTGAKFRAALHLPAMAYGIIGAGLTVITVITTNLTALSPEVHAILAIVLSVFSALGFSAQTVPVTKVTPTPAPPAL